MKRLLPLLFATAVAPAINAADLPADFTDGILLLNEDWFGHSSSSMNFLANDGQLYTNVYKGVNTDHTLGNTACGGQVFGDHVFVVSKQSYGETGGRLVVMNAKTLEFERELFTLPDGDGRSFCAVSEEKGYVGTAKGLYAINPSTLEILSDNLSPATKQVGEMLRYGDYVFAAIQSTGVAAINVETDDVTLLEISGPVGFAVTSNGNLYVATTNADAEFVRIDPVSLDTTDINIEGSHPIFNSFGTYRPASLAADTKLNKVYYGTGGSWSMNAIVAYDFDTEEFTANYFTIPGTATGLEYNQEPYGQAISVDPASGRLIITTTESGYGTHYEHNWMYFIDTTSGELVNTVTLPDYYWFPSMNLYPDYDAPVVALTEQNLTPDVDFTLNLMAATTLRVGNPHLVLYTAVVEDSDVATIREEGFGEYTLSALKEGETKLTVTATYQGRATEVTVPVHVSLSDGVNSVSADNGLRDVYTLSGVLVLRAATAEQIDALAPGLYIIGGRKTIIK